MSEAPKCKACGQRHWHPPCPVTAGVTTVTKNVTRDTKRHGIKVGVTPIVTEQAMIEAAVQDQHECPICGHLHGRPRTHAERQREYRQRQK